MDTHTCYVHKGPRFPAEVTNFLVTSRHRELEYLTEHRLQRNVVRFSVKEKHFFSKSLKRRLWAPSSLIFSGHRVGGGGPFPRLKRSRREANHSPSTAKVKSAWSHTFIPSYAVTALRLINYRNFISVLAKKKSDVLYVTGRLFPRNPFNFTIHGCHLICHVP
jgi:hypothetical protein